MRKVAQIFGQHTAPWSREVFERNPKCRSWMHQHVSAVTNWNPFVVHWRLEISQRNPPQPWLAIVFHTMWPLVTFAVKRVAWQIDPLPWPRTHNYIATGSTARETLPNGSRWRWGPGFEAILAETHFPTVKQTLTHAEVRSRFASLSLFRLHGPFFVCGSNLADVWSSFLSSSEWKTLKKWSLTCAQWRKRSLVRTTWRTAMWTTLSIIAMASVKVNLRR